MAKMFPSRFPLNGVGKRLAERQFFDCCEQQLDDSWSVIYSKDWFGKRISGGNERGEADFVLLNANLGIFIAEVKGGQQIYRKENIWYTMPHYSNNPVKKKNPFIQAGESKSVLWAYIEKHLPTVRLKAVIKHFVVLPGHTQVGDLGTEAPRELICDKDDLKILKATLSTVANFSAGRGSLSEQEVQKITKLLLPSDALVGERHHEYIETVGRVKEFGKIQRATFQILPSQQRLVVLGGPGSGLNDLAFSQAIKTSSAGIKTLLICSSKSLMASFRQRMEVEKLDSKFLQIYDYFSLFFEVCGDDFRRGFPEALGSFSFDDLWLMGDLTNFFCEALVICESEEISRSDFYRLEFLRQSNGKLYIFGDRNLEPLSGSAISCVPDVEILNLNLESESTVEISKFATKMFSSYSEIIGAGGTYPKVISAPMHDIFELIRRETKSNSQALNIGQENIGLVALDGSTNEFLDYDQSDLAKEVWELGKVGGRKFDVVIGIMTPRMLSNHNSYYQNKKRIFDAVKALKSRDLDAQKELVAFDGQVDLKRTVVRERLKKLPLDAKDVPITDIERKKEFELMFHERGMRKVKLFIPEYDYEIKFENKNLVRIWNDVMWEAAREKIYRLVRSARIELAIVTTPELHKEFVEFFKISN